MRRRIALLVTIAAVISGIGYAAHSASGGDLVPPDLNTLPADVPFLDANGAVIGHVDKACLAAGPDSAPAGCPESIDHGLPPVSETVTSVTAEGLVTEKTTEDGVTRVRQYLIDPPTAEESE